MNRKTVVPILFIGVFLVGLTLVYFYYPRKVHFDFVNVFAVKQSVDHVHEIIFSEQENLQHVSTDSTEILYYTDIVNSLDRFDFKNYDYLFVIGKEAMEVRHSPYIKYFIDMESHYTGIPVRIVYKESLQNKIFVYRLPKNPKYRHLCC